jgi:dipeptidyl aminopeptidase/acylaminoacyl peptidase
MTSKRRSLPLSRLALAWGLLLISTIGSWAAAPTFRDVLSVPTFDTPRISPDGTTIAYVTKVADWEHNRYHSAIYVVRKGEASRLLVDGKSGTVSDPRWSPDGASIAFLRDDGAGAQIYLTSLSGGETRPQTKGPTGVMAYEWSPDGSHLAFLAPELPRPEIALRTRNYGDFAISGEDPPRASLWLLDIKQKIAPHRLVGGTNVSVTAFSVLGLRNNFSFSPDGKAIAFTTAKSLNIVDAVQSTVAIVDVESGAIRHLTIGHDNWDETPIFSPDGSRIIFSRTSLNDFPTDNKLLIVPAVGGKLSTVPVSTATADHQPMLLDWMSSGIHVFFLNRTTQLVARIDPNTGTSQPLTDSPDTITFADVSRDGRTIAALGHSAETPSDVYRIDGVKSERVTQAAETTARWPRHNSEIVRWRAPDGLEVEGILYSRSDQNSGPASPLIVYLHGGPRELATPIRLHNDIYPIEQWLEQGARVFVPNYRGSTGYGLKFERGNLFNYGHLEALDVYSGIDALAQRGLIDPRQVAVAGHSWGGYLSAFLSTSSSRFKAALVAAGIVDNRTNYVLTNGGAGKQGYLRSTPWENPRLWESTSAVAFVAKARTPTLILQGTDDPVVPPENARILERGLADMGVPVKLVMFSRTEHNISRPKEQLAAMWLNWSWYERYLWNRPVSLPWENQIPSNVRSGDQPSDPIKEH